MPFGVKLRLLVTMWIPLIPMIAWIVLVSKWLVLVNAPTALGFVAFVFLVSWPTRQLWRWWDEHVISRSISRLR